MVFFRFKCGFAATESWNKRSSLAAGGRPLRSCGPADRKSYTANGLVLLVINSGYTQNSRRAARWDGLYESPQLGLFLRAEGIPKRRCYFEFVAAKRHLSPRRPATGRTVDPKTKKFKFFCFFRRNLHPRVEYYTYKGRDHKE